MGGSLLKASDESIGTLSDGVFTASALGEVQIQLVAEDGTVLGSKTLKVVEPTDIQFTKNSVNAVYGTPVTLPLEATYNENPVKINSGDVVFGYVKVSLASIEVSGETVNTNLNELVYDYPEAGAMEGFDFTANEAGGVRTLTIGAILKNKVSEFEASYAAEYQKVYQEAISNQASEEQAKIQAQNAAISKALGETAQIAAYMYKSSEAEFDFNTAYGDSLLSWNRTVPNAEYKDDNATYYLKRQQEETAINYTFAVDMSKVAIPEKLTKLLYMLPGGDQEGRTAWDFLLQLAERISPLTSVTVSLQIPEGFTADTSELRLANELFTLSSYEVENGVLKIVCNFIAQSEPINPTTVNSLCVLSGLKLVAEDGAWPLDGSALECVAEGELSYDIYAHFHVLESLAQDPAFQEEYGLFPYNNTANIPGDSGAHFMDTISQFEDRCYLQKDSTSERSGWYWDNGSLSYYVDGAALTGVHELPSHIVDESGRFWYDFGTEGKCSGKLTGLFEKDGSSYYARLGVLATGWQSIADADGNSYFYYFDKTDGRMLTGYTEADVKGLFYTFDENGKLVRGAFRTDEHGTKYFVAGESWFRRFVTLEEGTYWIERNGYIAHGNVPTVLDNVMDYTWYHFDEETGLMTGLSSGFITYGGTMDTFGPGKLYYVDESGKPFYGAIKLKDGIIFTATAGLVYQNQSCYIDTDTAQKGCNLGTGKYWCDENGYIVGNGFADIDGATYSCFYGTHCGEDKAQLLYPLTKAQTLWYLPDCLYQYHRRNESTMHQFRIDTIPRMMATEMFALLYRFMKIWGMTAPENLEAVAVYYLKNYLSVYYNCRNHCTKQERKALREYPWDKELDKTAMRYFFSSKLSMRERIKLLAALARL